MRVCICLGGIIAGGFFFLAKRTYYMENADFFFMNMEIATNFEAVKCTRKHNQYIG